MPSNPVSACEHHMRLAGLISLTNSAFNLLVSRSFASGIMSKKALLILANGAEEMEAVIPADVLRRAGIDLTIAGLDGGGQVKCSRNVVIVPDKPLSDASGDYDVVILPGGAGGSDALAASKEVGEILRRQDQAGKLIATICAAAIALKSHGICLKKQITSHPSKKSELVDSYNYSEDRVVVDGHLITSRGPGTAFEFALKIVELLLGSEKVAEIVPPMILK